MRNFLIASIARAFVGLLCAATLAGSASPALAVANPNAIQWSAPPVAFVTSLYVGVLGRAPESAAVVAAWAKQVDGTFTSRLRVFSQFIGSPEYRGKYGAAGAQGKFHLWQNYCPQGPFDRYRVAVDMPVTDRGIWRAVNNNVSLNYGLALAGYRQAAFPYQRCPAQPGAPAGPPAGSGAGAGTGTGTGQGQAALPPGGSSTGVNLRGGDYRNFTLPSSNPALCQQACAADAKCRAWTYVNPGVQGKLAHCWLKHTVPRATREACCVSGVVR